MNSFVSVDKEEDEFSLHGGDSQCSEDESQHSIDACSSSGGSVVLLLPKDNVVMEASEDDTCLETIPIAVEDVPIYLIQPKETAPTSPTQDYRTVEEILLSGSDDSASSFDGFGDRRRSSGPKSSKRDYPPVEEILMSGSDDASSSFDGFGDSRCSSAASNPKVMAPKCSNGEYRPIEEILLSSSDDAASSFDGFGDSRCSSAAGNVSVEGFRPGSAASGSFEGFGDETSSYKTHLANISSIISDCRQSDYIDESSTSSWSFNDSNLTEPNFCSTFKDLDLSGSNKYSKLNNDASPSKRKRGRKRSIENNLERSPSKRSSNRGIEDPQRPKRGSTSVDTSSDTEEIKEEEDFIGTYCDQIGCTITFLDSMCIMNAKISNGIVYELDEFAKRIAWKQEYVAMWILRLSGYADTVPTEEDCEKVRAVLKRRKALLVTLSGMKKGEAKMKEFDSEEFYLPSTKNKILWQREMPSRETRNKMKNAKMQMQMNNTSMKTEPDDIKSIGGTDFASPENGNESGAVTDDGTGGKVARGSNHQQESLGVSKCGRIRKASAKGKVSIEFKYLFMEEGVAVPQEKLKPLETVVKKEKETKSIKVKKNKSAHSRYFRKNNFKTEFANFMMEDGRIIPTFKELDYNLGVHCSAAGLTVADLNTKDQLDIKFTNGMMKELYEFYFSRGSTTTALVVRLHQMFGKSIDPKRMLSAIAKVGELGKSLTPKDPRLDNLFTLPNKYVPASRPSLKTAQNKIKISKNIIKKDRPIMLSRPKRLKQLPKEKEKEIVDKESEQSPKGKEKETVDKVSKQPPKGKEKETVDKVSKQPPKGKVKETVVKESAAAATQALDDNVITNEEVDKTRGKEGAITRGDIVYLYTNWLKNKKKLENSVFVTDLLKDVESLMTERKIEPIRVPAGTLMSSSVRLLEEYKQMRSVSPDDAIMYLEDDWLEDIQYLVAKSGPARRNTVDGENAGNRTDGEEGDMIYNANVEKMDMDSDTNNADTFDYGGFESDDSEKKLVMDEGYDEAIEQETKRSSPRKGPESSSAGGSDGSERNVDMDEGRNAAVEQETKRSSPRKGPEPSAGGKGRGRRKIVQGNKKRPRRVQRKKLREEELMRDLEREVELIKGTFNESQSSDNTSSPLGSKQSSNTEVARPATDALKENFDVDEIIDFRHIKKNKNKRLEYLVRWCGFGPEYDSWVDEKDLKCPEMLSVYWDSVNSNEKTKGKQVKAKGRPGKGPKENNLSPSSKSASEPEENWQPPQTRRADKENSSNMLEILIQKTQRKLISKRRGQPQVTIREVLELYDTWRMENQSVIMAGGSNSVKPDVLVERVTKLMESRNVQEFYPDSLLNACFLMTLIRMRLKNDVSVDLYLENNALEVLQASHKQQQRSRTRHNLDDKVLMSKLQRDFTNLKGELAMIEETQKTTKSAYELAEKEVKCLENIVRDCKELNVGVVSRTRQELRRVKAAAERARNRGVGKKVDDKQGRLKQLKGDLKKYGVKEQEVENVVDLVIHKLAGKKSNKSP